MKYFEVLVNYKYLEGEDAKVENNNINEYTLNEKKIERLIARPRHEKESGWDIRRLMDNTNDEFIKDSDKDKSAFIYSMGDGELRIIIRISDECKLTINNYANNIFSKLLKFENISKKESVRETTEVVVILNRELSYQEISSAEYFIEKLGYYLDDNDKVEKLINKIKLLMEKMGLFNYSVRDLCDRYVTLYLDFVTTYNIGEKLTKDELIEEYSELMFNEEFAEEINRIYDGKDKGESNIVPIHYKITENDKYVRQKYYECLGKALYSTGRVKNKKQ